MSTPDGSALPAFAEAIAAQQRLQAAMTGVGLDPATDFPQIVPDVNRTGEPRVVLGSVSTATADRLADIIRSAGTTRRR